MEKEETKKELPSNQVEIGEIKLFSETENMKSLCSFALGLFKDDDVKTYLEIRRKKQNSSGGYLG